MAHGFAIRFELSNSCWRAAPDWRYAWLMDRIADCELCARAGGELLWEDDDCRVVRATDAAGDDFPGLCRVVWHRHVAEMSDLPAADARRAMDIVLATERAVRRVVRPDKVNLASLGNVVPHLHWHVIPRWRDDSRYPAPIWAAPQRSGAVRTKPASADLRQALATELSQVDPNP